MGGMSRTERNDLIGLARRRARVAKQDVEALAKAQIAEVEEQLAATFAADDVRWKDAIERTQKAVDELNQRISAELASEGLPKRFHPAAGVAWRQRGESSEPARRGELRRLARARIDEKLARSKADIDRAVVRVEADLLAVTTGDEAKEYLLGMPSADELLPKGFAAAVVAELLSPEGDR